MVKPMKTATAHNLSYDIYGCSNCLLHNLRLHGLMNCFDQSVGHFRLNKIANVGTFSVFLGGNACRVNVALAQGFGVN